MNALDGQSGGELGVEAPAFGEGDPVAVLGLDGIVEGWIPKLEGRMSDGLNEADLMRVRAPGPDGNSSRWIELDLDNVVAVAAPPRPPSPARVARRQHAIEIDAGPYRVHGTVHLPLGADPRRYVGGTGRRWLPLTNCTVALGDDAFAVDVVIVNMDYAVRRNVAAYPPAFL